MFPFRRLYGFSARRKDLTMLLPPCPIGKLVLDRWQGLSFQATFFFYHVSFKPHRHRRETRRADHNDPRGVKPYGSSRFRVAHHGVIHVPLGTTRRMKIYFHKRTQRRRRM